KPRSLFGGVEIAGPQSPAAMACRGKTVRGRVALGQLEGEADRRAPGPLDRLAVAVGVAPAAPDIARCDHVKADECLPGPVIFENAVKRRGITEGQWPIGRRGPGSVVFAPPVDES